MTTWSNMDVLEQLRVWALSHEGGERVVASMERSVPFVRQAALAEKRHMLRARVDAAATKGQRDVWTSQDDRRLMAGMRAKEPVERTAYALRRTVGATIARKSKIRSTYPEAMWREL